MAIDRNRIIAAMSSLEVTANRDGLIPGFGVLLNRLPASFWNGFAELLVHSVDLELVPAAQHLLMNAGNECGYHTGHGIMTSEEWKAVVEPMIENGAEDILHGLFAVCTGWGWAKAEIADLIPGEKMVVRAYDYYESDVVERGVSRLMSAYMIQGICAGFMDLAYGRPYPDGFRTFSCRQVKGIEAGDDYGEFVVTRS
jgi:hypothetical protein